MKDERFRDFEYNEKTDEWSFKLDKQNGEFGYEGEKLFKSLMPEEEGGLHTRCTTIQNSRKPNGYTILATATIYPEKEFGYKFWYLSMVHINDPRPGRGINYSEWDTDFSVVLDRLLTAYEAIQERIEKENKENQKCK